MRTGVASGKKRASSATVLVFAVRDGAVACCAIRTLVIPTELPVLEGEGEAKWRNLLCIRPLISAVGLPLFPVRKSFGEPESAVMQGTGASPRPPCRTEGLALRRYIFQ